MGQAQLNMEGKKVVHTHPVEKKVTQMLFFWEWEEESEAKAHNNHVKDDLRQVSEQRTAQIVKMCAQNGKMNFPQLAVLRNTFCVYIAIL